MARHEIFVADIKINLPDVTKIKAELGSIEKTILSSAKRMSAKMPSPKDLEFGDGPRGGLSDATVKQARRIRAEVTSEFEKLSGDISRIDMFSAIEKAADRVGTTSDKIVAKMKGMNDDTGKLWKEFADGGIEEAQRLYDKLVGHSIIIATAAKIKYHLSSIDEPVPQTIDRIIEEFNRLPDKTIPSAQKLKVEVERTFDTIADAGGQVSDVGKTLAKQLSKLQVEYTLQQTGLRQLGDAMHDAFSGGAQTLIELDKELKKAGDSFADTLVVSAKRGKNALSRGFTGLDKAAGYVFNIMVDDATTVRKAFRSIGDTAANVFYRIRNSIHSTTPAITGGRQSLRETIGQVEQAIKRMPEKSDEAFLVLRRQFNEVKNEALKVEKTLEQVRLGEVVLGASDEDVRKQKEKLNKINDMLNVALAKEREYTSKTKASVLEASSIRIKELQRQRSAIVEYIADAEKSGDRELAALKARRDKLKAILETKYAPAIADETTRQLSVIKDRFDEVGKEVSFQSKGMIGKFRQVRDGLSLMSGEGSSKLYGLREAIFGFGEAGGVFGKVLDKMAGGVDKYTKKQGKLEQKIAQLAEKIGNQFDALEFRTRDFGLALTAAGVQANFTSQLKTQATEVEDMFERIQTSAESTGKVSDREFNRAMTAVAKYEAGLERLVKTTDTSTEAGKKIVEMANSQRRVLNETTNATRGMIARMNKLGKESEQLEEKQKSLGTETKQDTNLFGRLSERLRKLFGIFSSGSGDIDKTKQALSQTTQTVGTLNKSLDVLKGAFLGAFGGTLLANITDVRGAISGLTGGIAAEIKSVDLKLQAAFQFTEGGDIVKGVFGDNFGRDITDVGDAVNIAVSRFQRLGITSNEVIQDAVEDAFRLRDAYNIDVQDSFDAVQVLIKNFGLTSAESFDFIAGLSQRGVIGPDVLDSITEYSVQIANAGGNAETLFNLLETGFQGSGTLGTDKAIDLFKEFRVRILDGTDTTKQGLKQLGIASDDLLAKLSDGTVGVADAFEFVVEQIRQANGNMTKQQAGVALMGTMYEDLGGKAVEALSTTGVAMSDLTGATEQANIMYTDFASMMSQAMRNIKLAFLPVQESLLALGNRIFPLFQSALDKISPIIDWLSGKLESLSDAITQGDWEGAINWVHGLIASMVEGVSEYLNSLVEQGFDWGAGFMSQVAEGIYSVIGQIIDAVIEVGNAIADYLMPGSPPKKGPLSNIDEWGNGLVDTFGGSWESADFSFVEKALSPIQDYFAEEFGKGGFQMFSDVRDNFVEIVEELNRTGKIDETAFQGVTDSLGEGNDALKKFLRLQLENKKAMADVSRIEEEISAAEKAGFVPKELRDKLRNAKKQVAATKEQVSWQEKFLDFQNLSEDSFGRTARAAASVGAAGAKGAARATKAIKGAVNRQLEFINSGYARELAMLDDKLSKGEISQKEYTKELIRLETKYLDASRRSGVLAGIDEHSAKLVQLKKDLDELGGAGARKTKGFTEGTTIIDDFLGVSGDGKGLAEETTRRIGGLAEEAGTIVVEKFGEGAKKKISAALSSIGDTIRTALSGLFGKTRKWVAENVTSENFGILSIILGGIVSFTTSPITSRIAAIFAKVATFLQGSGGFGKLLKTVAKVGFKFGIIGAIIIGVIQNWDTVVEISKDVWQGFMDGFGEFFKSVSEIFTKLKNNQEFQFAMDNFKVAFGTLLTIILQVGGMIKKFPKLLATYLILPIGSFVNNILERWKELSGGTEGLVKKLSSLLLSLSGVFGEIVAAISDIFASILLGDTSAIGDRFGKLLTDLQKWDLGGAIANLFAPLGKAIATALSDAFRSGLEQAGLTQAFADFMGEGRLGGEVALLFKTISENIKPVAAVIGVVLLKVTPLLPMLGKLAVFLGKVSLVITVVVTAVKHFNELWPYLEGVLAGIVRGFTGVVEAVSGFVKLFSADTFDEGFQQINSGFTDLFAGILQIVIDAGSGIATFLLAMGEDILSGIADILRVFGQDAIADQFDAAAVKVGEAIDWIREKVDEAKAILHGLVGQLKTIWELIGGDVGKAWGVFLDVIVGVAEEIWSKVVGWFTKLWDDLVGHSIITDIKDDAIQIITNMKDNLLEVVATLALDFIEYIQGIPDEIKRKAYLFDVAIKTIWNKIKEVVSTWPQKFKDYASDMIDDFVQGVKDRLGDISNAMGWIKSYLPGSLAEKGPLSVAPDWEPIVIGNLEEVARSVGPKLAETFAPLPAQMSAIGQEGGNKMRTAIANEIANIPPIAVQMEEIKGSGWFGSGLTDAEKEFNTSLERIKSQTQDAIDMFTEAPDKAMIALGLTSAEASGQFDQFFAENKNAMDEILNGTFQGAIPRELLSYIETMTPKMTEFFNATAVSGEDAAARIEANSIAMQAAIDGTTGSVDRFFEASNNLSEGGGLQEGAGIVAGFAGVSEVLNTDIIAPLEGIPSWIASTLTPSLNTESLAAGEAVSAPMKQAALDTETAMQTMSDNLVGHSIIPDMNTAITTEFNVMSANIETRLSTMTATVSETFTLLNTYIQAVVEHFKAMMESIDDVETAIRNLISSIEALMELDLSNVISWMGTMADKMSSTASDAKKLKKYLEAALKAAKGIGDTLGGNVGPSGGGADGALASGAWKIPFDGYRAILHKDETVLPSNVASHFRNLMMSLDKVGIGSRYIGMPSQGSNAGSVGSGVVIGSVTMQFPNVTSPNDARGIEDAINAVIARSRAAAVIGG